MLLFLKKTLLIFAKYMNDSGISFWSFVALLFAAEFILLLWMAKIIY
ncbi:hypothetical protein BvCmsF63A_03223 [Escherichia coli]|uniref:Uncharacterized protein n=1 Tax=Escherichia coli TaxID=562 RepID=A0A479VA17_ECOLX|nr:hypothetical protein BvCmsH19A_00759 [Escherichia coli]GCK80101.1 hypothetical protein BvCmsF63A_03223 [Escherichia coli]SQY51536.1 Uncharacterised protein [Escherichia coli]